MLEPHELKGKKLGQSVTNNIQVHGLLAVNVVRGNTMNLYLNVLHVLYLHVLADETEHHETTSRKTKHR